MWQQNNKNMSQEELLVLIYKKDEKAFTYLYDSYSKSLFAVINTHVKNSAEAEVVLQQVFVKIWNTIDSFPKSKLRFYTWMLNIARKTAMDQLLSKKLNTSPEKGSSDTFLQLLENDDEGINKADTIGVQEFVKKMKPKCIQIIDLLFFKGRTQQEVSDALEIHLGTVKTHHRDCMNDLRNYLKL